MGRGKPPGYFSEEFKDLVGKMMEIRESRIDMDGIMNHPWVKSEEVPTHQEIKMEFKVREDKAKAALEEERQEKKKQQWDNFKDLIVNREAFEDPRKTCFRSKNDQGFEPPQKAL